MLKSLFKKKEEKIYAPINGKIVKLEDVPDPVFSQKMMGEGMAIQPEEGKVLSPVDGKIVQLMDSKHAIGIEDNHGNEILIHIGLETVELKGEGFQPHIQVGDTVSVGQLLMEFDVAHIEANAKSSVTPIVITNSGTSGKSFTFTSEQQATAGETVIIEAK
ncbi:PTS sugar transporter subunit IIA [Ornithinibacillus xuwenensis]|uniref:PTS glucose transporter subunit IIA n=1 Tax=Ornithinibacillus xuwenensis TaxID=3144668 RepID=A0ABU9XF41_9BACI